jgi:OmpA-OmpF porin, OOP family
MLNRFFSITISFILYGAAATGQPRNIITNPSFEDYFILPTDFTNVKQKNTEIIPRWNFIDTPDYFHKRSKGTSAGAPKNFAGRINPMHGRAYAGLILRADPVHYTLSPHYSEHIQNKLDAPLAAGQLYCLRMYISLAHNSGFAVDGFGALFTKDAILFPQKEDVLRYSPQIENPRGNILIYSGSWMLFSGIYRAAGGEEYITFGNFMPLEETAIFRRVSRLKTKMHYFSYYFIDNVSLTHVNEEDECYCTAISHSIGQLPVWEKPGIDAKHLHVTSSPLDSVKELSCEISHHKFGKIELGRPIELRNVYFDFDKYDLLPQSFAELDLLGELMSENLNFIVEISGHTDSHGNDTYNKDLSENRAKSVVEYLLGKGIGAKQLSYKGYGSSVPVDANDTEYGRQKNRRVEFVIQSIVAE